METTAISTPKLYFDAFGNDVTDLNYEDIKPEAQTVEFKCSPEKHNVGIQLRNTNKSFPNIKELVINANFTGDIYIDNELFPNVRKITSKSVKYPSGKYLCKIVNTQEGKSISLLNVFCRSNEEIDMAEINDIGARAFSGCRDIKLINMGDVTYDENSFRNSDFEESKEPVMMAGNIVISVNTTDTAEISKEAKSIMKNAIKNNIKHLIIHDISFLQKIEKSLSVYIDILDIQDDSDFDFFDLYAYMEKTYAKIKEIRITEKNVNIKSVDGIIYTKDGKVLLYCPEFKTGKINIPDGTEQIYKKAFAYSRISEVVIPDSVKIIDEAAFYKSNISYVKIGKGINGLYGDENGIFEKCKNLYEIDIPANVQIIGSNTFAYSGLKKVHFHEGLKCIDDCAFDCRNLKEITLPESVEHIGTNNFRNTKKFSAKSRIPNAKNICMSFTLNNNAEFCICGNVFHFPYELLMSNTYWNRQNMSVIEQICLYMEISPEKLFTKRTKKMIYDAIKSENTKAEFSIIYYKEGNEEYKFDAQRNAEKIAKQYVQKEDTDKLIELLNLDILSKDSLNNILSIASESKNTMMISYILKKIREKEDLTKDGSLRSTSVAFEL